MAQMQAQHPQKDVFFSQENEGVIQGVVYKEVCKRVGGDLNERQAARLVKTVKHYMGEVYRVKGGSTTGGGGSISYSTFYTSFVTSSQPCLYYYSQSNSMVFNLLDIVSDPANHDLNVIANRLKIHLCT